jgi:short-subunit dehydrogenase
MYNKSYNCMAKTVLITGSSKGLGRALALVFSKNGYDIILHGRTGLDKVKKEVLKNKVKCYTVKGDITNSKVISKLTKAARDRKIDILINNAGIISNKLLDASDKEIEAVLNINLVSVIKLTNKIVPMFKRRKKGMIININSTAGLGLESNIYGVSKVGLKAYTDSLRKELKTKYNVRVLEVYPGGIATTLHYRIDKAWAQKRLKTKQLMKPQEVADLIYSLTRDNSVHVDSIKITRRDY